MFVAAATRRASNLRAEGIGTVAARDRVPPAPPVAAVPVVAPDGRIRQHRGVTLAPGLYVVGQRFQHRRDSASSTARGTTPRTSSPTCAPASSPALERAGVRHERLRRRRGGRPGGRRLDRAAAGPGRPPGRAAGPGPVRQRHALDARADARRRAPAVPLGPAAGSSRRARRRCGGSCFHYARRRAACGSRSAPAPASTRSTPRAGTCSTGCSWTPPPRRAHTCCTRRRVTDVLRDGRAGCPGSGSSTGADTRRPLGRRLRDRRGRHPRRSSPGQVGAAVAAAGPVRPAPSSTRYYARRRRVAGYEWAYGDGAAAGMIPTNDGLTCVFVGDHPERMRAPAAGAGADATPSTPLHARGARLSGPAARGATRVGRDARLGRRARASSAARRGRAGRWSATRATSRTRSPPTG